MFGARLSTDALFHKRAAEVVRAGTERHLPELVAHFDPTDLDVLDMRAEEETRDGDDPEIFFDGRARA